MVSSRISFVAEPGDGTAVVTSDFDAPRPRVFEAWTSPFDLERWWGPRTQRLVVCQVDLRVGGWIRYVLRSREREFAFRGVFRDIVRPSRLVHTLVPEARPEDEALVTVHFDAVGPETTRVTETMLFGDEARRDSALDAGLADDARESRERLAEHLSQPATL